MSSLSGGIDRRRLLGTAGLFGAGAAVTAVAPASFGAPEVKAETPGHEGHVKTTTAVRAQDEMSADEMDAMHEAGVKSFPAPTLGKGGLPLEPEMDGDVKVYRLTASVIQWEVAPGQLVEAYAYNGMVPGPEIRVTEGDTVRVILTNEMPQSTAIHFHGVRTPNAMDGVPFITQPPIKPGETFTYEFTIKTGNFGSHMYHSHYNATEQVTKGLLGAFIIQPKDPAAYPAHDLEYTMILNDGPIGGYSLNGKSFPATEPIVMKLGQKLLCRYMNEGLMIHPMHLHGFAQQVIALDGYLLPQPHFGDTINIAPGQRVDVMVEPDELGVWAWHCHILSHAESPNGMFGMVTALIVEA